MADIPLPKGYKGSTRLPKTQRVLKNCFNTGEYILPRPGIASLGALSGTARGSFIWNGSWYVVNSNDLYKVTTTGSTTLVGSVGGSAPIDWAIGFNHAVIVVREVAGAGYTLDFTDTLTEITDTEFESSNSVSHMNGRFIYIPFSGDPAFFSDVGNGASIQTDAFFDAEELPDKNKVSINIKNILFIGGTDSFELFRDIGTDPVPYRRLNTRVHAGYIGGIIEYASTFAFVGREKDQDVGIYLMGNGEAVKISNEAVDSILIGYSESALSITTPARFKWRGYDIVTFTLGQDSFGYWNGEWFVLDTITTGGMAPWPAGYVTHYQQQYYTSQGSNLGYLEQVNTDYGEPFERVIGLGFYNDNNDDFTAQSIELGISQGYTGAGTVGIQLSRDNVLYSDPFYRSTGAIGQYTNKLVWNYPGGLGYYDGFMGVRLSTTDDIEFAADKLTVTLR